MRAAILPIGGGKAEHSVSLSGAVTRRGLEVLTLHVQYHRAALVGQQVRDHKARGLATARGGHDQGMWKDLGHHKRRATAGRAHLAQNKPMAWLAEKSISLHLPARLPMGFAKAG